MKLVSIFLTCADTVEADQIVKAIFADKLAACIKQSPVNSTFYWDGKIQNDEEVLLVIETVAKKFSKIESVVKKIHSYKTPVLVAYPVIDSSAGVEQWVKKSLK